MTYCTMRNARSEHFIIQDIYIDITVEKSTKNILIALDVLNLQYLAQKNKYRIKHK